MVYLVQRMVDAIVVFCSFQSALIPLSLLHNENSYYILIFTWILDLNICTKNPTITEFCWIRFLLQQWELKYSLTHCCAWPAEGRSILHIEQSWLAIWAAPTDRPMSSSTCCSQVLRGRSGGRFQSAVARVPVWASIDSCSACKTDVFSGRRQMWPNNEWRLSAIRDGRSGSFVLSLTTALDTLNWSTPVLFVKTLNSKKWTNKRRALLIKLIKLAVWHSDRWSCHPTNNCKYWSLGEVMLEIQYQKHNAVRTKFGQTVHIFCLPDLDNRSHITHP